MLQLCVDCYWKHLHLIIGVMISIRCWKDIIRNCGFHNPGPLVTLTHYSHSYSDQLSLFNANIFPYN